MKKNKQISGTDSGTSGGTAGNGVPFDRIRASVAALLAEGGYRPKPESFEREKDLVASIAEVSQPTVRASGRAPRPTKAKPQPRKPRVELRLLAPRAMGPNDWTAEIVIAWITEAFSTLRALPRILGPQGFKSNMPETAKDPGEAYGYGQVAVKRALPSADAIDRLDVMLDWQSYVSPNDWRLLAHWCLGSPRAELGRMIDRDRSTVYRWVHEAAAKIAKRMASIASEGRGRKIYATHAPK